MFFYIVFNTYPRSEMPQTVKDRLQVFLHNSPPLPTAGWVVEEVEQGPALPPPPGQGYVAEETQHTGAARSVPLAVDLQDSVHPEVSLEEWSECTVQRWV